MPYNYDIPATTFDTHALDFALFGHLSFLESEKVYLKIELPHGEKVWGDS